MQCKVALALLVACFAMSVSAAPVAEVAVAREPEPLDRSSIILPRIVEDAREPAVEEAREPCTLYTCIWYVRRDRCGWLSLISFRRRFRYHSTKHSHRYLSYPSLPFD
ncbi:hypothetical protein C8R45DRAFT_1020563 [Mycena sanguinolenta]|nr:hypothetical protein C8R45DRAFT_1020563 [Mycena sanguinolenta]